MMTETATIGYLEFPVGDRVRVYARPVEVITATRVEDVLPALHRIQDLVDSGLHAGGFVAYEAAAAFDAAFQTYQRSQPILNVAAFLPLPHWVPRGFRRTTRASAAEIRELIKRLVQDRQTMIDAGQAPDDLATKIMTTNDPETGKCFDAQDMVDQVAIFFLAGHETSASALAWAMYLCAANPDWQARIADEANALSHPKEVKRLIISRDVFRETLRLYPPVPMMVRQSTRPETFRKRAIPKTTQFVPCSTLAVWITAPMPVVTPQPM